MAKINLLPWREALRKERAEEFFTVIGVCVMLVVGLCGSIYFVNSLRIAHQEARNQLLTDGITRLEAKIEEIKELNKEKKKLEERIGAIERLQGDRPLIVRFFDEMVTSLPDDVSFNSVVQKDKQFTISGVAQSNARVSSLLRKLDESEWLTDPELDVIEAQAGDERRASNFTLRFKQMTDAQDGEEDQEG